MDGTDGVKLAERLTRIEEGQRNLAVRVDQGISGLRADLARFLDAQKEHDERVRTLEREQAQHCTILASHATTLGEEKSRMDKLANRITTWGGGNSIAILFAYVLEFLRGP